VLLAGDAAAQTALVTATTPDGKALWAPELFGVRAVHYSP
jgi:hypothetical protein